MQRDPLNNIHIQSEQVMITPAQLKEKLPISDKALAFVQGARNTIADIIHRRDHRLLVICGPCSIHDMDAAKEYATRLKALHDAYQDSLYIVMRVYFEKPRTTVGWKGFINDPNLDGTFDVELGLHRARELLCWLAELELPLATEALDPISPQYLAELFSWSAIGARTTESQTHREMASGLSMPVGFKNGTDGNLGTAINALQAASSPHAFMGINQQGQVALLQTQGNPDGHVILRGGKRLGQRVTGGRGAGESGPAAKPCGGLQPRQLQQGSPFAAQGGRQRHPPDPGGQPLHHRGDARIQPVRGKPVQRAAQAADALRGLHH